VNDMLTQRKKRNLWLGLALLGSLSLTWVPGSAAAQQPAAGEKRQAEAAVSPESQKQPAAGQKAGSQEKTGTEGDSATQKRTMPSNVPVKTEPIRKVREVNFVIQHGQLVSEAIGDVDGDGVEEVVDLMGDPVVDKSSYMGNMYVIVRDLDSTKVKYYIRPQDLGGYNAYLTLSDVTGTGWPDVIIAAPSGGPGETVEYRILDFSGTKPEEVFTAADNRGVTMVGTYLPDYKVRLSFPNLTQDVELDLASQKDAYRSLNVYGADGSLKSSGLRPLLQNISQLSTLDVDGDGVDELVTLQKVMGVDSDQPLGTVRTVWGYRAGVWQPWNVSFRAELYAKPAYENTDKITGTGGYEITDLKVGTDTGEVEYPHFQKLDGKIAWRINNKIETFVRDRLREAVFGTRLNLTYEVKYTGRKYASVMLLGLLSDRDRSQVISRSFNFNLTTGEEIPLKELVRPWYGFWNMVKKEGQAKGIAITEDTLTGYYYDGSVLGLLDGNRKELDIPEEKVLPFLAKNRIGEEFLTSQSNEGSVKKLGKISENKEKNGN
jgi:hypothetical protein